MSSPFIQRFKNVAASQPGLDQLLPVAKLTSPVLPTNPKGYNPFLTAMNTDSQAFKENYGVNRPLSKPMFLGYRDNKALYGGGRLFLLY